jgi:penicillin amidase
MGSLQSDVISLPARQLQPMLRAAIEKHRDASPATTRSAADMLLSWDGALREDSAPAVLYELWAQELSKLLVERIVPAQARLAIPTLSAPQVISTLESLAGERDSLLLSALTAARARLRTLQGDDPTKWSWGALHQVRFRHALDATPATAALFDSGPFARSGDDETVQATSLDARNFEQVDGASYREVFDVADWDRSLAINVPGQSGQPGSTHYADLLPLWRGGEFFQLAYSKAAVDAVTTDVLDLEKAEPPAAAVDPGKP